MQRIIRTLIFACFPIASVFAITDFCFDGNTIKEVLEHGIHVDLREPDYTDGELTTCLGGVITGPDIRVQAQKIRYINKEIDGVKVTRLEAENDVMLEFGEHVIVGRKIIYDFETKTGIVYEGRTAVEPWFFGGETIKLCPDGSYVVFNGFITTTETTRSDWAITTTKATLNRCNDLRANNATFRFMRIPIFWMPSFKINLNSICDMPFRYQFRLGGRHGPRLTMIYEVMNWKNFKTFFRFDYRFKRGPGAGLVTEYRSPNRKQYFRTINYLAKDESLTTPRVKNRYRFQGVYYNCLWNDKVSIDATYDKFSDRDVPTDYHDKGLQLCTGQRTQFHVRRQECNWIGNFLAHWRVNSFQTVNQQIPSLDSSWRPFVLGCTGIVSDMRCKLSYLDFVYDKTQPSRDEKCPNIERNPGNKGYNASRVAFENRFYRPFTFKGTTILPEANALLIHYGNSPQHTDRWMIMGQFGLGVNTHMHRFYGPNKHIITPYAEYQYFTYPTANPNDHFIFSIDDGWFRVNQLKAGLRNNVYRKCQSGCITRFLYVDLYANAFFATSTIPTTIPKLYADIVINPFPTLKQTCEIAWNVEFNQLDHFNFVSLWTVNQNIAFSIEYRHRGDYDWRKVDRSNFILDSYRSVDELLDSELSDKRDTILLHFYTRFHPNWALEFQSRNGWNRSTERNYLEYATSLSGTVQSNWHLKIFYRHKENDDRVGVNFNMGFNKPCSSNTCNVAPCLEF